MKAPLVFRPYSPSSDDTVYHDSLPAKAELEGTLRKAQKRWLLRNGLPFCPWSQDVESILLDRYPEKLLDFRLIGFRVREGFDSRKLGACALRRLRAVDAVRAVILEEEHWGAVIGDNVIRCNHVHLLFVPGVDSNLKRHLQRIKGRASCYLGRAGLTGLPQPVWQR